MSIKELIQGIGSGSPPLPANHLSYPLSTMLFDPVTNLMFAKYLQNTKKLTKMKPFQKE